MSSLEALIGQLVLMKFKVDEVVSYIKITLKRQMKTTRSQITAMNRLACGGCGKISQSGNGVGSGKEKKLLTERGCV